MLAAEINQQQLTPLDIRVVASLRTPQQLVAQECGITDEAMRYLVGLPHLEHLDLRGNRNSVMRSAASSNEHGFVC
jgi:hypothetical protein